MKMFKNGLSLKWLLAAFLCAALFGCTADYDTFGQSDYRVFNEIAFEEGESGAMLYADEHKIVVSLDEIPDSLETWDSATISLLDISSMATLHLVDGKFKEFPSDSAALDSLAQELSYAKDRLHEGDKVRIPSSGTVYLMLVSESGIPSLWQVVFEIPEKKVKSSSSNKESGDTDAKSSSSSAKEGSSSSKTGDSSSGKSDASSSSKEPAGSSSSAKEDNSASSGDGNSSAGGDEPESSSSVVVPANAPKLLRLIAGAGEVEAEIDQDAGTVFLNMNYAIDLDLRDLEIKGLELSDGATASVKVGESYNFARGLKVTLENDGVERTYTVKAGYQYPGSEFNEWIKDDFGNKNDIAGWDNGNNSAISSTKTLTVNEDEQVVKMESIDAKILGIGKFASGNMLVAYFNPKGVGTLNLTKYDDGNELIDFGRPFYGRPKYVEFDVKYEGKGDSCDLYVILEHRSRASNEGKNQYRTSSDVNTMIASAWYRATTVESEDDPDVVSITDAGRSGYKTIRLAFKYGEPHDNSPIHNSSLFTKKLLNSAGIDNHVVPTDSPDDFDVTHIRVVMASSALGNLYKGSVGATLWADEMRLIY
ncbi:Putative carbohydrate metabolism domain-containing protein [Fibrobacter sp. UWT3]|uniref:PCMD domain-containing protein n=1 Tax=Fibrobacter sp. UWT3 TaxID=1896225 RepID=UPI000BCBDE9B|nr:PCMD domain-containing protein [Fibrobacter sp. UWT3]SOE78671.1 Putative carbohydrate metabolism domain-containing protein [Fibrobacter sp. UWT3]